MIQVEEDEYPCFFKTELSPKEWADGFFEKYGENSWEGSWSLVRKLNGLRAYAIRHNVVGVAFSVFCGVDGAGFDSICCDHPECEVVEKLPEPVGLETLIQHFQDLGWKFGRSDDTFCPTHAVFH